MLQLGCDGVERGFCERLLVLEVASRARFDNHVYDVIEFCASHWHRLQFVQAIRIITFGTAKSWQKG